MIGADTNVIVRALVEEGTKENHAAARFFRERSADDPIHVGVIVIAELVWVLERCYRYPRSDVVAAVRHLLDSPEVVVEQAALVAAALDRVEELGTDIADALIAAGNARAGCRGTVTFDRDAAKRVAGMELLK
ncbi:MAG TPA: type II toxin-antitoxin system VapC family toxin [Alphaproteobacteria bacterium]|nr:type II toxin-antitoxin system VapC family toxin [Alphaproteobacteria bacterium]